MVGRQWWGFLGFDDCKEERDWSSEEIHVLKTAAALIAGAVESEEAHERIRVSEERYALAARGANDGLFDGVRIGHPSVLRRAADLVLDLEVIQVGVLVDRLARPRAHQPATFPNATPRSLTNDCACFRPSAVSCQP